MLSKYSSVEIRHTRITDVRNHESLFELVADNGAIVQARTIILATGLKETLPAIASIHDYYGKSVFCCPYCDGWELKEKPLVVIAEESHHSKDRIIGIPILGGLHHDYQRAR